MEAERWPIDYDALQKGDVIPSDLLERVTNTNRESAEYAFAVLKMKDRIERELHDRNRDWTLRIHKGEIKVLTDPEAATFNHAEQVRARAAMMRRFLLALAVDVSLLDEDQRKQHERNVEVDGKYIQSMRDVRKQLACKGHQRNTPALPAARI